MTLAYGLKVHRNGRETSHVVRSWPLPTVGRGFLRQRGRHGRRVSSVARALQQRFAPSPPASDITTRLPLLQPLFLACYLPRTWGSSSPPTSWYLLPPPRHAAERTSSSPPSTRSTAGPLHPDTVPLPRLLPRVRPCPCRRATLPPLLVRPRFSGARHRLRRNQRLADGRCTSAGCL